MFPRKFVVQWPLVLLALVSPACEAPNAPPRPVRLGYSANAWTVEDLMEQKFRAAVSADEFSSFHRALTRRPHPAGSDGAREVANSLARLLAAAGLDVEMREYKVWLSRPREVSVSLVAPVSEPLRVTEPASALDPDTRNAELGPGYVAYSASGDVTAPVVYVNYGLPADYARLAALGVEVRNRIVLARYGKSHRAVKLFTAQEHGAAGIVLYSDPADDGFARGDTWPSGLWRTSQQLQRGNAKYSWFWHGDALTPGAPATESATRLDPRSAPTLPRIPAAVLSWGEARKILSRLAGRDAPAEFRGALPLTYRLGAGEVRVHLRVRMDDDNRVIRDVIARVRGSLDAPREVLFGTHHDAWTFGGVDPGSGAATLLEVARALGALRMAGWRPKRTITFAFWDAEEYGLIGSTEYAEDLRDALRDNTVLYVNTDLYMNGRLDAGGTPSLREFVAEVAKDLGDTASVQLKALGSGADFVPFQDFLGLPTLSLEYTATGGYGYAAYHSNYDTRFFMLHVADPGFRKGTQLARLLGTVAMRMSNAPILPFRFASYTDRLREFAANAEGWGRDSSGREAVRLDLGPMRTAIEGAAKEARELDGLVDRRLTAQPDSIADLPRINDLLARMEQRLMDESDALDKRWYRHVIYGWNIYSLYEGQPFPGLAEAIRLKSAERASEEIGRITVAVERFREGLADAASRLK